MANQIIAALPRVTDANGNPVSGAKAYVYQTGTTTPVDTYADEALAVLHPIPVVANSSGFFPQIFYGGAFQPKIVVTDAAGAALYQYDPAPMLTGANSAAENVSFAPVLGNPATNVQDAIENIASAGRGASAVQATTSGTSKDFTGIDSFANQIEVVFDGVSLSGTNGLIVQVMVGGAPVAAGYLSTDAVTNGATTSTTSETTGALVNTGLASGAISGRMTLTKVPGGNVWVFEYTARRDTTTVRYGAGKINAGGIVSGIRITRNGSDTFDGGQAFIRWSV